MSKERLEEASKWLRSMYDLLSLKTDIEDIEYTQKRIDLFNWLFEQAEKVEELGKVVDKQSQVILRQDSGLDVMEQQNKRYRETIQNAFFQLTNEKIEYANWKAQEILSEALESDSNV